MQKQTIEIPLFGGQNESIDPKLLPIGSEIRTENALLDTDGVVKKRTGYTTLTSGIYGSASNITDGYAVYANGNELLALDGRRLYSYNNTCSEWTDKGWFVPCDVNRNTISDSLISYTYSAEYDIAAAANNVALMTASNLVGIIDLSNQAIILTPVEITGVIGTGSEPRLVSIGNNVFMFCVEASYLDYFKVDTTSFPITIPAASVFTDTLGGNSYFNIAVDAYGNGVVAWDTGASIKVQHFDTNGAPTGNITTIAEAPSIGSEIGIATFSTGNIQIMWRKDQNVRYVTLNGLLEAGTIATADSGCIDANNFNGIESSANAITWIYNSIVPIVNIDAIVLRSVTINSSGAVVVSAANKIRGGRILTRPFKKGGDICYGVYYTNPVERVNDGYQETQFLVNSSNKIYAAFNRNTGLSENTISEYRASLSGTRFSPRPSSIHLTPDETRAYFLTPRTTASFNPGTSQANNFYTSGPALMTIDFTYKPVMARFGESAYFSGGVLNEYDGDRLYENNFFLFPEPVHFTTSTTGGFLSDGTYLYQCHYEYLNSKGEISRSSVSYPVTISLAGGTNTQKITLVYTGANEFTNRSITYIKIVHCLTTSSGTVYYWVTSGTSWASGSLGQFGPFTSVSNTNPYVYTTGGFLESTCVSPSKCVFSDTKRLYSISEDGTFYASKEYVSGYAADFSEDISLKTNLFLNDGYVAMGSMSGRNIILSKEKNLFINGQGPLNTGADNDYTAIELNHPHHLHGSNACVSTQEGIFYPTTEGIANIGTDLSCRIISYPLESNKADTITSIVANTTTHELKFTTIQGDLLSYNIKSGKWNLYTGLSAIDSCIWNDKHVLLKRDGVFLVDDRSSYYDHTATPISLLVETPWIKVGMLTGFQRVWNASVIGEWRSAHTLNLSVYYDYSQTASETKTFDVSTGYSVGDPLRLTHKLRKKCTAVKFRIWDTNQSGTGESCKLTAIDLEIAGKNGLNKQPSTKIF